MLTDEEAVVAGRQLGPTVMQRQRQRQRQGSEGEHGGREAGSQHVFRH